MLLYYYVYLYFTVLKIADYIVALVYYYATLLLYLPLLHRLELLIISLHWHIIMLLYYYTHLYFTA